MVVGYSKKVAASVHVTDREGTTPINKKRLDLDLTRKVRVNDTSLHSFDRSIIHWSDDDYDHGNGHDERQQYLYLPISHPLMLI